MTTTRRHRSRPGRRRRLVVVDEDEETDEEDVAAEAPRTRARSATRTTRTTTTSCRRDDVEADLDQILKDRMVTVRGRRGRRGGRETDVRGEGSNGCCPSSRTSSSAPLLPARPGDCAELSRRRRRLSHLLLRSSDRPMIHDPLAGLVEHSQRKVVLARLVGKSAVDRAIGQLRDRLAGEPPGSPFPSSRRSPCRRRRNQRRRRPDGGPTPIRPLPRRRHELVLPDYDRLPAATSWRAGDADPPRRSPSDGRTRPSSPSHDPRQDRPASDSDGPMIDPMVRRCQADDAAWTARVLELKPAAALVGERGGERWLAGAPPVGDRWRERCRRPTSGSPTSTTCVVGYMVPGLGADYRQDRSGLGDAARARSSASAMRCSSRPSRSARERGAVAVEGESLPGDRQTKNLYERAGIIGPAHHVSRRLHEPWSTALPVPGPLFDERFEPLLGSSDRIDLTSPCS